MARTQDGKADRRMSPRNKRIAWGFAAALGMGVTGVMMTNWNNAAIGNCAGVTEGRLELLGSYGLTDDMCNRAYDVYHDGVANNDMEVSEIGGEPFGLADDVLTIGGAIAGLTTLVYVIATEKASQDQDGNLITD